MNTSQPTVYDECNEAMDRLVNLQLRFDTSDEMKGKALQAYDLIQEIMNLNNLRCIYSNLSILNLNNQFILFSLTDNQAAASETKIAEVDTSDDDDEQEEESTGADITGPELTFHSVKIRNRGRVPVLLSKPPDNRLYYYTKSGNKTFCTPLQLETFSVASVDDIDVEGINPLYLLHLVPNGCVHNIAQCWCHHRF
jgi:hypothetical protein